MSLSRRDARRCRFGSLPRGGLSHEDKVSCSSHPAVWRQSTFPSLQRFAEACEQLRLGSAQVRTLESGTLCAPWKDALRERRLFDGGDIPRLLPYPSKKKGQDMNVRKSPIALNGWTTGQRIEVSGGTLL
jgi:hypothetical protein